MRIYLLHGWAYSTDKWTEIVRLLKKEGFDVVLPKIPGLTEKIDGIWSLNDYVNWLNELLRNEKDIVLVGHSNGGRIAIKFASQNPEKIKNLILIDSAGIYHNDIQIRVKRIIFNALAKAGKKITSAKDIRKLLYKLTREKDYEQADEILKKTMKNLISEDLRGVLPKIKNKTLIIWGRNDDQTPLRDGKTMHCLIPKSKLEVVDGARHSPQFTHPEIVTKLIVKEVL